MWLQLLFSIVFVQIVSVNLVKQDPKFRNEPNREAEAVFAGVIRNISRVNNVLQELINNYEHLQKIYKSQENLDDETSDGEIDEVYKNKKRNEDEVYKSKKKNQGRERSNVEISTVRTSSPKEGYPATQMIWSDNDKPNDNSEIVSTDGDDSDVAKQMKEEATLSKVQEEKTPEPITNQNPIINIDKGKKSKGKKKRKPATGPNNASNQAEVIFIDTHTSTTKRKKIKPSIEPLIEVKLNNLASRAPLQGEQKTRYSKVSQRNIESDIIKPRKKKTEYLRLDTGISGSKTVESFEVESTSTNMGTSNQTRNVEKKLHSELFSPKNIWDDIINNKPIELQAHNEMNFEKMRKDGKEGYNLNKGYRHRTKDRDKETKTALVIVTKKKQSTTTKGPFSDSSSDHEVAKDEFQATVLREAYGDACLKLVVRKCYKACKAAGKVVCERYKCKSAYKESYSKFSKYGCLQQFKGKTEEQITIKLDKKKEKGDIVLQLEKNDGVKIVGNGSKVLMKADTSSNSDTSSEVSDDTNANQYLRACLPHIQADTRRIGTGDTSDDFTNSTYHLPAQPPPTLNILRDKYERACKKISFDKCRKACHYAYTKVCELFTCNNSRRRAYKKACASRCRAGYRTGGMRRSSSDSTEISDSSSGSTS